jgi:hypothetical protein
MQWPPNAKKFPNMNYCWTHGGDISDNHTSMLCQHPAAPYHQPEATRYNTMGGSQKDLHKIAMGAWHIGAATQYHAINTVTKELFMNSTFSRTPPNLDDYAIADTGTTGHYLKPTSPHLAAQTATNPIHV